MDGFSNAALRRMAGRAAVRVATAVAVVVGASFPVLAGNSPQGDTAAAWPAAWNVYRLADGNAVHDVVDDENPDDADLSSGPCTGTGCAGTLPTVYYASDGTNAFFRMRIAVDPYDATKGGLAGNAYLTQIAVGGTVRAVVGVDGKSASVDYVYTATAPGTTVTQIYTWPFTAPSAGMRVVPDGTGQYFIDYQVPVARITAASGGTITASTPVQLFYGSSAAANLATINKDFMTGGAVSFDDVGTISLQPAALTAGSSAVVASGPDPAVVGEATTYTITLTLANTGGGDLTGATAGATLPAGVTYVSGPGSVSVTGSALTWTAGTLLPGETETVEITVSLTPSAAGSTPLLSAVSGSGTDNGTGSALTASAPALTVTAIENAPPVAGDDDLTVAEDGSATVSVLANDTDADGDALTVGTLSDPTHGSVTESGGVVTYTPDANYAGPDSFTYEVCDVNGVCDTGTVTVVVTAVNDPPSDPADASFATPEDTAHSGTLPGSVDPDGDPLTYAGTTQPDHGTVTVEPDGSYTYTPDPGYSGPDSFGYEVCDPSDVCATETDTVTVTPVNDAPPAPPGTNVTTPEDTATGGTLPGSVDPDGDPLTFGGTTGPDHGSVTVEPDGSYTYTPDAGYFGPDAFGYEVCDPSGACAAATANVSVTAVNDAPTTPGASLTTAEDTASSGILPGTDPDGDSLDFALTGEPAHGTVDVDKDGSFTYTPDPGYAGPDSFGYEVCDPSGACATGTVTVTVTPVNDLPVAADDTVPTAFDTAVTFDPTANDSDADGDTLTITVGDPEHGTVTVAGTIVTYTPDAGWSGDDTFTYEVCDPAGGCDTATITVTVAGVLGANLPPVADAGADRTVPSGSAVTLDGTGSSDPDLDPLTYVWVQVGGPTVTLTGATTATPAFGGVTGPATLTFRLTVSDGVLSDTDTVTIVVAAAAAPNAPDAPACEAVAVETAGPVTVELPCTGDTGATTEVVGEPAHGEVEVLDGTAHYVPDAGFTGTDSFTVRVCTAAGCTTSVVTVTVTGEAPTTTGGGTPLPRTGTPTDVLVALAFVLVVAGVAMQRPPQGAGGRGGSPKVRS